MKRMIIMITAIAVLPLFWITGVVAESRYNGLRTITLSPDLAEPWMLQMQKNRRYFRKPGHHVARQVPNRQQRVRRSARKKIKTRRVAVQRRIPRGAIRPSLRQPKPKNTRRKINRRRINPKFLPTVISYSSAHKPGTVVVNTQERFLYLVLKDGQARRYGVGVGRPGFEWAGVHKVTRKKEWPNWRPPSEMRKRQPGLPEFMPGGPANPLGARALYLGSTLYRIHGSNEPWSIGRAVSSGCIRMRNKDVIDLYKRVPVGSKVVVI